jgi:hypothetical protein
MRRLAIVAIILLIAIGIAAPFLNANHFLGPIQSALESSLNRRVTIGEAHFSVFTGPGFTVEDVLIDEAPGMGIEPFAHVKSIHARIKLSSLWTGHLAFSNLSLIEPSVNFAKSAAGPWNIQPFLNQARLVDPGPHGSMPDVQIREGRLNFRIDKTKSVFYVDNADLDLYPNPNGDLVIRFSGEPARTDHASQGLGRIVARGTLRARSGADDQLNMSVQLERTAITEITRLFDVQDIGVRGFTASNVKLDGPLSHLNISGDLRIEDIHRWDLMPNKGEGWTLNYAGSLNVPAQQLDIETRSAGKQDSPVNGKFTASGYLTEPKWQATLKLNDVAAGDLLETARHMGASIPAGATLTGRLNGELDYSRPNGMTGALVLNDASFKVPQGGVTEFASAPVAIRNNSVKVGPAAITFEEDQAADLQVDYNTGTQDLSLGLETKLLSIARTKDLISRLLGTGSVPLLERCRQGLWRGSLNFERAGDGQGTWTGGFELQNAQLEIDGFSAPLRLVAGTVQLQADQTAITHMRGRMGDASIEGDYRFIAAPTRPDRMRLIVSDLQISELERLLLPTLARQQGFLARALRLERIRIPEWLRDRSVEGTVQIRTLRSGDAIIGSVGARLTWNGARVELLDLQVKSGEMQGAGKLAVSLAGAVPRYNLTGVLRGIDYRGGSLDLDGALETSGTGGDLRTNAKSDGTFTAAGIALGPDVDIDEISGDYHAEAGSTGARLALLKVQVTQGQEVLHGQGATQPDGHLVLELVTIGRKQVRMTGMLLPLHGNP